MNFDTFIYYRVLVGSDGTGSAAGIATNTGSPVIAATIPTSQIQGDILSGPTLTSQGRERSFDFTAFISY